MGSDMTKGTRMCAGREGVLTSAKFLDLHFWVAVRTQSHAHVSLPKHIIVESTASLDRCAKPLLSSSRFPLLRRRFLRTQRTLFDLRICGYLYVPSMLTQDFSCRCSICVGEVDKALDGRFLGGCVGWRHGCVLSVGCVQERAKDVCLSGNRWQYAGTSDKGGCAMNDD